jgi:hypothetical protein
MEVPSVMLRRTFCLAVFDFFFNHLLNLHQFFGASLTLPWLLLCRFSGAVSAVRGSQHLSMLAHLVLITSTDYLRSLCWTFIHQYVEQHNQYCTDYRIFPAMV